MMQSTQQISQSVRRVAQRGTSIMLEQLGSQNWTGQEFKKHEYERLKLANNPILMIARGTSRIRASDLASTKMPDPKGYIITARGTGRKKL